MPARPEVHNRTLDTLFVVATVALVLASVIFTEEPLGHSVRGMAGLGLAVALAALWLLRRRATLPAPVTVAFAVVAVVTSYTIDNILGMLSLFCAILLLVIDIGPAAGWITAAVPVVLQPVMMLLLTSSSVTNVIDQTLATAAILAFILAFAVLLRHSAIESHRRAELLTDLRESHTRLRRAADTEKELVLAQERARAARELHDGLGHRLTVAKMALDFAARSKDSAPERAWQEVETARRTTQEAMAEMRLWVRALNPVSVDGLHGVAALDALGDAFRGTGLDVRFTVTGTERPMPDDLTLFCHRFVQEGLTNALRHASPTAVTVDIAFTDDDVTLRLEDTSPAPPGAITPGFGLRSLGERAQHLGGGLAITPGEHGLRLSATVPLADNQATDDIPAVLARTSATRAEDA